MNDILVAVDGEQGNEHVLAAAVDRAATEGASLVVLYAMPPGEYDARQGATATVGGLGYGPGVYGITAAREGAQDVADRLAVAAVGTREVHYVAVGTVGALVPTANAVAAEYGCETVVLAEERSPVARFFGRAERQFAGGFGGSVVRVPGSDRRTAGPKQGQARA